MRTFQNSSIRRKQMSIIMLTSSVVLGLACAAFVAYDTITFRGKLVESVSMLADVIGSNCAAAIDFSDPKTALETLEGLRADGKIVAACVYSRDGSLFAVYKRSVSSPFVAPVRKEVSQEFTTDELLLFRPITQHGERVGTIFVASDLKDLSSRLGRYMGIVGVVFLLSLLLALILSNHLQRVISEPILQLAQVARLVAQEKNYSIRAKKQSIDELGLLVDGFNEMLEQIQARDAALATARDDREQRARERALELEITHKQLVEASRRGGMAEIATNVLHNVGNVLNSVNVSTNLIGEQLRKSKTASLTKGVKLLREHKDDVGEFLTSDPKGKQFPRFLEAVAEQLLLEQAMLVRETQYLQQNIDHIKQIVTMQQSYAKVSGALESLALHEVLEDALRMSAAQLTRHNIQVVRQFEEVPHILMDRHQVLQILINLVRNAKQAMMHRSEGSRLSLRIARCAGDCVQVEVTDNGMGIASENLVQIFNHGFTTKKDGHGFGLHSGANTAKEMGGSLTVRSEGIGAGTTFVLELPVRRKAAQNSAPQPDELQNGINQATARTQSNHVPHQSPHNYN